MERNKIISRIPNGAELVERNPLAHQIVNYIANGGDVYEALGKALESHTQAVAQIIELGDRFLTPAIPLPEPKEVTLYEAFGVVSVFKQDMLPAEWLPKKHYFVQGIAHRMFTRPDLLKVWEKWYFDTEIAPRLKEAVKVMSDQLKEG